MPLLSEISTADFLTVLSPLPRPLVCSCGSQNALAANLCAPLSAMVGQVVAIANIYHRLPRLDHREIQALSPRYTSAPERQSCPDHGFPVGCRSPVATIPADNSVPPSPKVPVVLWITWWQSPQRYAAVRESDH